MTKTGTVNRCLAFLALFCGIVLFPAVAEGKHELNWRSGNVDATVEDWPLKSLLARVAAAARWKVYVDPELLDQKVSVTFREASQADALRFLLGSMNYALVPGSKGHAKLYVYKSSVAEATSLVLPDKTAKATNWLSRELIVTVPPGSKKDVEKLASELNGKVVAKSDGLNAYRLQFPDDQTAQKAREALAERSDLDIQDNYSFQRPALTSAPSASPASLFPIDPKPVTQGSQVTVALVDTPIQPLDGKMKDFVLPQVHVLDDPVALPNDPTHATSMAETVLNSMAFSRGAEQNAAQLGSVRVLPIDIYGNDSSTTTFDVAQGLYKAIQANVQVINLSLGGTGESPMVDYLLEMAKQKQILVFASAGNTPTTDPTWPAANPNAIAVTATDWNGDLAPYANRGSFVDVKAPGSARVIYNGQTYISTGTSTATAFVSGQAAGLAAQGLTSAQIQDAILRNFNVNNPPLQRPR